MALWRCLKCGAKFAVGMRMCPQCTGENAVEVGSEEDPMSPKISKDAGPTDADRPDVAHVDGDGQVWPSDYDNPDKSATRDDGADDGEGGDGWDGTSSSASSEKEPTNGEPSSDSPGSPAPTTESPSTSDLTESGSAPSTDGETTAPAGDQGYEVAGEPGQTAPYSEWTKEALRDELDNRNEFRESVGADRLLVSGTVAELAERLEADDNDPDRPEAPPVETTGGAE